jgi:hypothetical protein
VTLRASIAAFASLIVGTTTNNNAVAGNLGEYVSQTVPPVGEITLTSGTSVGTANISLTAGDWDISGTADFNIAATTSVTQLQAGISLSNSAFGAQTGGSGLGADPTTSFVETAFVPTNLPFSLSTPVVRLSIATTTTVFLTVNAVFTVTGIQAYGTIRARRVR